MFEIHTAVEQTYSTAHKFAQGHLRYLYLNTLSDISTRLM